MTSTTNFEMTIAPGGQDKWLVRGEQAYCFYSNGTIEVSLDAGQNWAVWTKGVEYNQSFDGLFFRNTTNDTVKFTAIVSDTKETFRDRRTIESGPSSILGTVGVVGQPLSDDGGSIAQIGLSYALGTFAPLSDDGWIGIPFLSIVSSSINEKGAIIRTAAVWSSTHKDCKMLTARNDSPDIWYPLIHPAIGQREVMRNQVYLPPGQRLWISSPVDSSMKFAVTWDIL